jgi:hypothetical protein
VQTRGRGRLWIGATAACAGALLGIHGCGSQGHRNPHSSAVGDCFGPYLACDNVNQRRINEWRVNQQCINQWRAEQRRVDERRGRRGCSVGDGVRFVGRGTVEFSCLATVPLSPFNTAAITRRVSDRSRHLCNQITSSYKWLHHYLYF